MRSVPALSLLCLLVGMWQTIPFGHAQMVCTTNCNSVNWGCTQEAHNAYTQSDPSNWDPRFSPNSTGLQCFGNCIPPGVDPVGYGYCTSKTQFNCGNGLTPNTVDCTGFSTPPMTEATTVCVCLCGCSLSCQTRRRDVLMGLASFGVSQMLPWRDTRQDSVSGEVEADIDVASALSFILQIPIAVTKYYSNGTFEVNYPYCDLNFIWAFI